MKAKQIEYLINSLPEPEVEEEQAKRLQELEDEMTIANQEYIRAVNRASESSVCHASHCVQVCCAEDLHSQITEVLGVMLTDTDIDLPETKPIQAE